MANVTSINNPQALSQLASELGVRPDWHEPDEQGVNVRIIGTHLDNAMGSSAEVRTYELADGTTHEFTEFNVIITREDEDGEPQDVAVVNLATLLAFATGYKGM